MNNDFNPNRSTLYLDQDDVVADWMGAAQLYLEQQWIQGKTVVPDEDWQRLKQHHRFYRDLPLMPGAHELVRWAEVFTRQHNMNLAFLTAIPSTNDVPYVYQDKVNWAKEHFPGIPVFFGPYAIDKHKHCKPGDILIDDRPSNCQDWMKAGGIAHLFTTWPKCKIWIQNTLSNYQ